MKNLYKIVAVLSLSVVATSCFNKSEPNYQFFPNMYEAVPYETYSEHTIFRGDMVAQLPAEGTIKRGFVPFDIPHTPEGYVQSKSFQSPLDSLSYNPEKAKELYNVYCAICHGEKGDGKGNLVKREKFLGVPNYKDREITAGSIYYVETYGLNSMGSHANQLSQEERWQIADYVLKLRSEL